MRSDIKTVVKEVMEETLAEFALKLGINVTEPEEVLAFQQDMSYLRRSRLREQKLLIGFLLALVTAAAGWFVLLVTNYRGE